jgi:hypothetical protein
LHGAQEVDGAVDVDEVVVEGFFAGLADGLIDQKRFSNSCYRKNTLRAAK